MKSIIEQSDEIFCDMNEIRNLIESLCNDIKYCLENGGNCCHSLELVETIKNKHNKLTDNYDKFNMKLYTKKIYLE